MVQMLEWANLRPKMGVWMVTELVSLDHWDCPPQVRGRTSFSRPLPSMPVLPCLWWGVGPTLPWGTGSELYETPLALFGFLFIFYYILICLFGMFVWGLAHTTLHMWKSENNCGSWFYPSGGMELRLSGFTCSKPLSHLTCHPRSFLMSKLALMEIVAMIKVYF